MKFRQRLYRLAARAQGTPFQRQLEHALDRQHWSATDIHGWQLQHLNKLIEHARKTTSHYRQLPDLPLQSLDEMASLPTITKDDLRKSPLELTSTSARRGDLIKTTTGSTGAPVSVRKSRTAMAMELAATWRGLEWGGVYPGDRQARFWGVPDRALPRLKARVTDFAANRFRFSAFGFNTDDLDRFYRTLQKKQPHYCYGYVSLLRALAEHIRNNSYPAPKSIAALVPTAEPITEVDRALLNESFEAPVYNEYGCGELGTIAHECNHGAMHLNADNLIVEILDDHRRPVPPHIGGSVVVTDLFNTALPIIRYELADKAAISDVGCPCGIRLPVIKEIAGREHDILINKNGTHFHGEHFLHILKEISNFGCPINAVRLTQVETDYLHLEVAVATDQLKAQIQSHLHGRLRETFSDTVDLTAERVEATPREPSGKLRIVQRRLASTPAPSE